MRWHVLILLTLLTGCSSVGYSPNVRQTVEPPAVSHADKRSSPAKGTKTCHVRQYRSAHLEMLRSQEKARFGGLSTVPYTSDIFVRVYKNGSVGIAINEDTYPGTNAYFLISEKRYSGDGDGYVSIPKEPLMGDALVQFTYVNWPYRNEVSGEDVLAGFSAAYQNCLEFFRS